MSPDYRRPIESPTFAFPEPARAPIVRLWRTRPLLRPPLRRSSGLLCVCTLPDSPPAPLPVGHLDLRAAVRAGRVGAGAGPGAAAGLWRTRTLL